MAIVLMAAISGRAFGAGDEVDFGRDVQPLFRAHCYECHGPKQQKNGFRLDRRRDALRGGTRPMIGPRIGAGSLMHLKFVSEQWLPSWPRLTTGPLEPEQIGVIKAWIDQGAKCPDELTGETPPVPPDPKAARMMELLRAGDRPALRKMVSEDPRVANLKGPGGSTP